MRYFRFKLAFLLSLLLSSQALAQNQKLEVEFFSNEALRSSWFILMADDRTQRTIRVRSTLEKTKAEAGVLKWLSRAVIPSEALETSEGKLVAAASFAETFDGEIVPGPIISLNSKKVSTEPPLVCKNNDYNKIFNSYLKMEPEALHKLLRDKTEELEKLKSKMKVGIDSSVINRIQVAERKLGLTDKSRLTTRSDLVEIAKRHFHSKLVTQLNEMVNR